MFPSQGFFYSINCPDYLEGKCSRNYCHFNHNGNNGKTSSDLKINRSSTSKFSGEYSARSHLTSKTESKTKFELAKSDAVVHETAEDSYSTGGNKVIHQDDVRQCSKFKTPMQSSAATNLSQPTGLPPSDTANIDGQKTEPKEIKTDILQQLISEAVKKVLSENSCLNSALIDPNAIAKSLDTNAIITEAVKEVSGNSNAQENVKEKRQPRLYLPPPGTPSYKPTPISQLQEKSLKVKPSTTNTINDEYTPTSIGNTVSSNDGEITDFSTDEEEHDNEAKSEFDMLEEVLVESSSDPSRRKAILKRKKALGKLASTNIKSRSLAVNKSQVNKDKEKELSKDIISNHSDRICDTFDPPSPIFTSSSESNMGIYTSTSTKTTQENISDQENSDHVIDAAEKVNDNLNENTPENSEKVKETDSLASISKSHSLSISSTHNLLPQIANLSRPNVKSWSPIAKVDSILSVEKMLEQLDSLPDERKLLLESNNLKKISDPVNKEKDANFHVSKISQNTKNKSTDLLRAASQLLSDPQVENSDMPLETESFLQSDGQEKVPEQKKQNENESSSHQKLDSDNSSDAEKRRKIKKMHLSKRKQKKKRSISPSSESSYSSEESESEEEDEFSSESSEESSTEKCSKKRRRRKRSGSRYRKHKQKKRKSKHKKRKSSKRSRSRSSSSHKKSSHKQLSAVSSNNSSSNSGKSPLHAQPSSEGHDQVLLDESQIKKEKCDPDLSIVKIEKVFQHEGGQTSMNEPPCNVVAPTEKRWNNLTIPNKKNTSRELTVPKSSFQSDKENVDTQSAPKTQQGEENVTSHSEEGRTTATNASHSSKTASKPKVLKEFSIFEGLAEAETSSKKVVGHHNSSSSKDILPSKHKEGEQGATRRSSQESLGSNKSSSSHSTKSKSKGLGKQSKHSEDKVQNLHKKHDTSHSHEKDKDKEKQKSVQSSYAKDTHRSSFSKSSKVAKEAEKNKERHSSNSDKIRSSSQSKSKSSKSDLKSHKKEIPEHKTHKGKQDNSQNTKNKKKKEKGNSGHKEHLDSKENVFSKDLESLGSESPIPDLSALDEIPKEDWDQLLAGSMDQLAGSNSDSDGVDYDPGSFDCSMDTDDANDPKVMEECMKVFSEYDPKEAPQSTTVSKRDQAKSMPSNDEVADVPTRKSRVAYSGASGNLIPKPKTLVQPRRKTPAEIMLERYKKLKEEEMMVKKKLEIQRKELAKHGQALSSLAISSPAISSTSDPPHSAVSSSTPSLSKKRIARAPNNVSALLKSKEKLISSAAAKRPATVSAPQPEPKTLAMTNAKGQKRVAHIPKAETLERPVVSTEAGTKVPQNIRQRYLNCFIDETLKFCDGEEHAFNVALAEETICHKRATTRMVYLNLAVNVIKKLRASHISEAAQELLENDQKYKNSKGKSVSSPCTVSSSSSSSSAPKKKRFEHPINPNHSTISHFSVLASGGQKGSWSILKSKRSLPENINSYLTGSKFYKLLKKYILSDEQLAENGFPLADPTIKGKAIIKKLNSRKKVSPSEVERYCDRCSMLYEVDQWGLPIINTSCVYHWGRAYKTRGIGGLESRYSCCQGDSQSEGCCLATTHVSENFSPNFLKGYVRTIPKEPDSEGDFGVFALDCEMSYTTAGSELTRITVIDSKCKTVYETLVKPENPIIDYNTRFSGITEEDLEGVTVSLRDVQAALLTRFSEKTILMGHSLESDFSALKLIHETVVDTSVVFPHKLGPPFKRALRNLASEYLTKIIQNDEGGHDSAEDAITCMELMHWKVKEDLKGHV